MTRWQKYRWSGDRNTDDQLAADTLANSPRLSSLPPPPFYSWNTARPDNNCTTQTAASEGHRCMPAGQGGVAGALQHQELAREGQSGEADETQVNRWRRRGPACAGLVGLPSNPGPGPPGVFHHRLLSDSTTKTRPPTTTRPPVFQQIHQNTKTPANCHPAASNKWTPSPPKAKTPVLIFIRTDLYLAPCRSMLSGLWFLIVSWLPWLEEENMIIWQWSYSRFAQFVAWPASRVSITDYKISSSKISDQSSSITVSIHHHSQFRQNRNQLSTAVSALCPNSIDPLQSVWQTHGKIWNKNCVTAKFCSK